MFTPGSPSSPAESLDVMVVGEALIDVVSRPDGDVEHPGGSPANVAYGLGRLGVRAGLLTAIGDDARGAAIEAHLAGAGVVLLPGARSLERTASATATIAADGSASYVFDIDWRLAAAGTGLFPEGHSHRIDRRFPGTRRRRCPDPAGAGTPGLHGHLRSQYQAGAARQPP